MENPILDVKNIYKNFKEVKAVDGVSFFVNRGEFIALLGPNGAGKTTTVEMIEGIQKPNQGTISIMGMNWDNHENKLHRRRVPRPILDFHGALLDYRLLGAGAPEASVWQPGRKALHGPERGGLRHEHDHRRGVPGPRELLGRRL